MVAEQTARAMTTSPRTVTIALKIRRFTTWSPMFADMYADPRGVALSAPRRGRATRIA